MAAVSANLLQCHPRPRTSSDTGRIRVRLPVLALLKHDLGCRPRPRRHPIQASQSALGPARSSSTAAKRGSAAVNSISSDLDTEVEAKETEISSTGASFSWREHWYPVEFEENIDVGVPYKFTLFDEPCVAFLRPDGQEPVCYLDVCPHRRAPLSQGVLTEAGDVMCAYHGWRFNADGDCTLIPQTGASESCGSRACATAFPAALSEGFLWVYFSPITPGKAVDPPSFKPPEGFPYNPNSGFIRDMPVDPPLLLENILDPDHGEYAHGNFQGFKAFEAQEGKRSQLTTKVFAQPEDAPCEVTLTQEAPDCPDEDVSITWSAPTHVAWYRPPSYGQMHSTICFWVVPLGVGRARFISRLYKSTPPKQRLPDWVFHSFMHNFLDQDTAVIASQGAYVVGAEAKRSGQDAKRSSSYVFRSPSDKLLMQVGKFLDAAVPLMPNRDRMVKQLAPNPTEMAEYAPELDVLREKVLDRMAAHVVNCKACQGASRNLLLLQKGLLIAASVLAAVTAVLAAGALGSTLFAGGAASQLNTIAPRSVWLMAALSAFLAGVCMLARRKAAQLWQNLCGYTYTNKHYQKDLQNIPGVLKVPIDLNKSYAA